VSAIVVDTIHRIQKISYFLYRLLPTDTPNVFSKIKKTQPGSEPARPRSELADPLLQRHALPYAGDGDAEDEAAGAESERCTHSELRRSAHAKEHLVHVAPKEAATGPNLEEAGGSDDVQSKGGRSTLLGKKGGAPLLMPLGKKRGVPRSPRLHAVAPPDATADGEEEGSVEVVLRHFHRCRYRSSTAVVLLLEGLRSHEMLAMREYGGHEDLCGSGHRSAIPYVHGRMELYCCVLVLD
jgi:hypothetical protein